ncbi:hypothetical protein GJA_5541 [Janthinobacterium agaricidamnosum NBRC 102515 = DSM 9628]|uniref:Uncharacterized protein n=1 Tax=Janthinobacterium agaricidamnosum NBRC 102515 = DSM 9628 TaxID=1349767 RepID=W0VDW9_9BURK|nr:hypothetical protein GJA_5541 [Janthinobacterium agaricidamnosum NBRC 102515 = DSM 9628]
MSNLYKLSQFDMQYFEITFLNDCDVAPIGIPASETRGTTGKFHFISKSSIMISYFHRPLT